VFLAFLIHHAKRMRHVIFSSVASSALQHFSTLSHKWQDLTKHKAKLKLLKLSLVAKLDSTLGCTVP
jgi:hypothetical protein